MCACLNCWYWEAVQHTHIWMNITKILLKHYKTNTLSPYCWTILKNDWKVKTLFELTRHLLHKEKGFAYYYIFHLTFDIFYYTYYFIPFFQCCLLLPKISMKASRLDWVGVLGWVRRFCSSFCFVPCCKVLDIYITLENRLKLDSQSAWARLISKFDFKKLHQRQ